MAKKEKAVAVQVQKFGLFYSDNECFGVYASIEEATKDAIEELETGDEKDFVICLLVPKRTIQALRVVVEDV